MATLIPNFSTCSQRMTSGERRFAQRLESKLEDDYRLWYNVPIGRKRLHPDFIVLHPLRGIIVLEVKDWKLSTIQSLDPDNAILITTHGCTADRNPLQQARDYMMAIADLLQQDALLVQGAGPHRGKLAFPYSYGLVFTNITRKQFDAADLGSILQENLVICQDEMYEDVDPMDFQQRLWNLCTYSFGEPLTTAQIDRVRWHLFPEIRIGTQISLFPDPTPEPETLPIPDLIRVMDMQQEQLARSLKDGHRVIHGVAGSGKTLILVYRCLKLVEELQKPILVLCYNKSLAARLRHLLNAKGIGDRQVSIRNFHGWCSDLLRQHHLPAPPSNQYSGEVYFKELVQRVIEGVNGGKIPAGSYGAVLIDEGHDFLPEWFRLVVQMVDPNTNTLLLLYDDAQHIYGNQRKRKFSFKSVGIQAQGRTTILKVNYRNTEEILSVAYTFAQAYLSPTEPQTGTPEPQLGTENDPEDSPLLVLPESAGRHGPQPQLIKLPSFKAEVDYLIDQAQQLHGQGIAWGDMAVVYRNKWMAEVVGDRLQKASIPTDWINQAGKQGYDPGPSSIKLVTMHSSKGLEFPVVFIPGLGYLPDSRNAPEDEARLLYVAMTRAIDQLVMTGHQPSSFMKRLGAVVGVGH